jgi:hypothetical protein
MFKFMVFYATFNNISVISWQSVLLVEETLVSGENHQPVASHWETLSQCCIENTSPWTGFKLTTLVVIGIDCTDSCKFNYHMISTTTTPQNFRSKKKIWEVKTGNNCWNSTYVKLIRLSIFNSSSKFHRECVAW